MFSHLEWQLVGTSTVQALKNNVLEHYWMTSFKYNAENLGLLSTYSMNPQYHI
jgi:hypothetical protein